MLSKIVLCLICLALINFPIFSANSLANINIGIKEGDFIEYTVTFSGNVPAEHDVDWAKIEVTNAENYVIDVAVTSIFSDGREETVPVRLNLETGQLGDCFIIPANLSEGDIFLEQFEDTITISGVEEKFYAGSRREIVTASGTYTTYWWDKTTGFLVEAISSYPDFSLTTKAEKTNLWQAQTFGLDPLLSIILIVLAIILVYSFVRRRRI